MTKSKRVFTMFSMRACFCVSSELEIVEVIKSRSHLSTLTSVAFLLDMND